mgnify:CR=1 FL=1
MSIEAETTEFVVALPTPRAPLEALKPKKQPIVEMIKPKTAALTRLDKISPGSMYFKVLSIYILGLKPSLSILTK